MTQRSQKYGLLALTLFTFLFLLGSRSLNEPDEGRYSEIAREMVETGDWVVPHLWYVPHLDKPPMTYWLVAASIKAFGVNEWAARLPLALAGISGVFAAFLLGSSIGGRKAGIWSALILQSSLLYFLMARMLTTDLFLTQFVTWSFYFFWRSRASRSAGQFFLWHLPGWIAMALGFLTKGPIALAIPLVAFVVLAIFGRQRIVPKIRLITGFLAGITLFIIIAVPWFLVVFTRVPESEHFMVFGQAAGHLLGTTIKNRLGSPFYFVGILAVGLLPWTILLGWLWRRSHLQKCDDATRDAWLLLTTWIVFTFALFSLSHAKLPAYILPIFPPLAVLLALRFFREEASGDVVPAYVWKLVLAGSMLLPAVFPLVLKLAFHDDLPGWMNWQPEIVAVAIILALAIFWSKTWKSHAMGGPVIALSLVGYFIVAVEIPMFETTLRANQTFKPLGQQLAKSFQPGDAVVCCGKFPQGLPFYSGGAISATNRAYLCRTDVTQVPFEFPGNRERMGELYIPDADALGRFLQRDRRVWIVSFGNSLENFAQNHPAIPVRRVAQFGQWELSVNH